MDITIWLTTYALSFLALCIFLAILRVLRSPQRIAAATEAPKPSQPTYAASAGTTVSVCLVYCHVKMLDAVCGVDNENGHKERRECILQRENEWEEELTFSNA